MRWRRATRDIRGPPGSEPPACTFTDLSPASRLILRLRSSWNGPHDPDVSAAPRVDPERLDGLSRRAADRVRVLRRRRPAGARTRHGTGARPGIAPALPVSRSRPYLCGRDERQRSVDAPVRVPRVRASRPPGPVAVVPLAWALRPDADALGSP